MATKRNILLILSYDGTHFCGWQRQDHADNGQPVRTVQAELEAALEKMHGEPVQVFGSGRTDSGVHAAGQAANFYSPIDSIPAENYVPALNGLLPPDICVHESILAPGDFHARFSTVSRTYRYFLYCGAHPPAYKAPFVWAIRQYPDMRVLNEMASCLSGEIDCTTFAAAGDVSQSKFRYIEKAVFFWSGRHLVFEITANAFLWKMVRSIVGSLVQFESAGNNAAFFRDALESKDRSRAGTTAPANGLFLWHVNFGTTLGAKNGL
jgi:tRNA pseudouridine38-40 synthase